MLVLAFMQGVALLCAQETILFQFAGTDEEVGASVTGSNYADLKSDPSLFSSGLRLILAGNGENTSISFSKGISAFSISAFSRISGMKSSHQDVGCLVRGYDRKGKEIMAYHLFDTPNENKQLFLNSEVLSKRPVIFFSEEVYKLVIVPVNLDSEEVIQFTIDGLSNSPLKYGPFAERYDYCSLEEIFAVFDYSGSVSDSELVDYKRYAWSQLSAFADKGLALRVLKYDEQAETEYYVEHLTTDKLVVGTELHHHFFKPPQGKQRIAGLTNVQSVLDYVSRQKESRKAVLIYTDDIPNLSGRHMQKLSAIEGVENMLTSIFNIPSPIWIVTSNKQLLGLSNLVEKATGKPLCISLDEPNYFNSALSCLSKDKEWGGITVFPNPSNGNFTIQCSNYEEHRYSSIQLRDASGRKVFQEMILNGERTNIETTNLSAGNYFLWAIGNNGATEIIPISIAK